VRGSKRLLVLNQYYAPGHEATAQLLAALCEDLASTYDVTVVTGRVTVPDVLPMGRHVRNGVTVIRVNSTSYDRGRLSLRAVNYLSYVARSFRAALSVRRPHAVLCMTDPPFVPALALIVARRFRVPMVLICQDVFPEIAVELGRLKNPFVVRVLKALVDFSIRRTDRIVVIGERMRERVIEKGASPERIRLIPNWTATSQLTPQPHDNEWAREHELVGRFVVMHSGNVGYAQNLDALIRAASFLRDLDDLSVVIVGSGARLEALTGLAEVLEVGGTVRFLPYQERSVLAQALSSAHVHVVGLAPGLAGYVVPSRLYGVLSVARPVIAAAEADGETARVVEAAACGAVVPPGRPELLAGVIRQAHSGKLDLDAMGRRAREYVVAEADVSVALGRYRALLEEVV
jgi:colanic acid biosynthesis glycosyl transferase WcaI